ncbi:MAG TPA: DUF2071 domain-containing protein, partial [Verrucomicrobiae bacterium]
FLHWAVNPAALRPMVPDGLELDLFDDKAWIGVTPFAMTGVRASVLPPIPGLDSFLELNVRTYVHYRGQPGVHFFSLDSSKIIPALAARFLYFLPYFKANMEFSTGGPAFHFSSKRVDSPAEFRADWQVGGPRGEAPLNSLEFFLVERYALFVRIGGQIHIVRIHHRPWILEEAVVLSHRSTMIGALGLPEPTAAPLAHFSYFLAVETWEPRPA